MNTDNHVADKITIGVYRFISIGLYACWVIVFILQVKRHSSISEWLQLLGVLIFFMLGLSYIRKNAVE